MNREKWKNFECESHDHNAFSSSKFQDIDAKIAITAIFSVLRMKHTHTSLKSLLQSIWKKIISKNFDVKKKTRVRNSKFKFANSANRISSSMFETSSRLHRETSSFDLQLAEFTLRISHEYSCAKINELVQFNKQNDYIIENLQDN